MHSPDGNQSPSDRRSSVRRSRQLSANTAADDDFDFMAGAVADGFRPTAGVPTQPTSETPSPSLQQPTRRQPPISPVLPRFPAPAAAAPLKGFAEFNRPSSTSKPLRAHDSLTLRTDGSGVNGPPQSMAGSASQQANGNDSYQGPTQPSHPYQMYPQRTFSNATGSAGQNPERQSTDNMPRGPTHPYLIYAQNAAAHSNANSPPQIPVGFNGMGNSYQRQIGPDGEEAGDLIGPLGHMEELPPYSRYPDEAYQPKPETAAGPSTTASSSASTQVGASVATPASPTASQAIPGAGGIGLATRNPEFSSTEDLPQTLQRTRPSLRSVASTESEHDVNGAARDFAEKDEPSKWQRRARKKLWGIVPYWAICLLMVGMILMGIIMGAVIGTIVSRHGSRRGKGDG